MSERIQECDLYATETRVAAAIESGDLVEARRLLNDLTNPEHPYRAARRLVLQTRLRVAFGRELSRGRSDA